jgi:hypothetical protein
MSRRRKPTLPPPTLDVLEAGDRVVFETKAARPMMLAGEVVLAGGVPYLYSPEYRPYRAASVRLLFVVRGGEVVAAIQDTPGAPAHRAKENNAARLRALHGRVR